jgi:hypothetical protein
MEVGVWCGVGGVRYCGASRFARLIPLGRYWIMAFPVVWV